VGAYVTCCARTAKQKSFQINAAVVFRFFIGEVPGLISDRFHVNPQPVCLDARGALGTVASLFRDKLYLERINKIYKKSINVFQEVPFSVSENTKRRIRER
jgi:hypothetical protein